MPDIIVHEDTDLFVFVLLQKQDPETNEWVPETNATKVDIELFDEDGVSIGAKTLASGVENVGQVADDHGDLYGKYRASFYFENPGVYKSVSKCEGSGGAKLSIKDMIPIDSL